MKIKVLNKGLKFTPTPRRNKFELKADIKTFTRKLKLFECFNDREVHEDDVSLVTNRSKFYPECNRNRSSDIAVDYLRNLNLASNEALQKSNLSKKGVVGNQGSTRQCANYNKRSRQEWKRSYNEKGSLCKNGV